MIAYTPKQPRRVLVLDSPRLAGLRSLPAPWVEEVCGWDDLLRAASRAHPSSVMVIDPFAGDGAELNPRALELLAACRAVPVVAMVPFREPYFDVVRTLLAHGLTDVADAEMECAAGAIPLRLAAAHAQPLKRRVGAALSRFTSANARTLLAAVADVAVDGGIAVDLGRVFGSTERTVAGWCEREALPPPKRLLVWMRVLLALLLLEDPRRTFSGTTHAAGYRADYALRRALREVLGGDVPPREHTVALAVDAFNAELRDCREAARQRARRSRAA